VFLLSDYYYGVSRAENEIMVGFFLLVVGLRGRVNLQASMKLSQNSKLKIPTNLNNHGSRYHVIRVRNGQILLI